MNIRSFLLSAFVLMLVHHLSFSQKSPVKFGKVAPADLRMEKCAFEESAPAMVLFEYGYSEISVVSGLSFTHKRHVRMKIFNKEGYDYADVTIRHPRNVKPLSLKATTYYLEDGKVVEVKMEKDAIFEEKVTDFTSKTKFTFPNVKEGCIIEYTYSLRFNGGIYNMIPWEFQREIPMARSEYSVNYPSWLNYNIEYPGFISPAEQNIQKDQGILSWVYKDVPSFKEEEFMPNADLYKPSVSFRLKEAFFPNGTYRTYDKSWAYIAGDLANESNYGIRPKSAPKYAKKAEELCVGVTDKMEKAKIIYNYVKDNIKWNGVRDVYRDNTVQYVYKNLEGTSSEINILLMQMLRAVDIESYPVAICTKDNGAIIKHYPMANYLNHTVTYAKVGDKNYLLDPTDKMQPFGMLNYKNLNNEGLLVNVMDKTYQWVDLVDQQKTTSMYFGNFKLDEEGAVEGSITTSKTGYTAFYNRKEIADKGEESYMKDDFSELLPEAELTGSNVENAKDPYESLKTKFEISQEDYAESTGEAIYLNPLFGLALEDNPFKTESRKYPIDLLYTKKTSIRMMIQIPEGYELEGKPTNVAMTLPDKSILFRYSVSVRGNIMVVSSLLDVSKSMYKPEQYLQIKQIFDKVIELQQGMIVLKKKAE